MDTKGEMITLPALTVAAVAQALNNMINAGEGMRGTRDAVALDNLSRHAEAARAALRELTTFSSMARSCARARYEIGTHAAPPVIDGGMSWDQAPDGSMLINDGDGRIVCELKPALLQGLSVEARAQLAQYMGEALGLITVAP